MPLAVGSGLFLLFALMGAPFAGATGVTCPNPNDPSVPLCPTTGILSEQFPVSAVMVSDVGGEARFATEYLAGVFRAQPEPLPQAYLMVKDENFVQIQRLLMQKAPSREVGERWLKQLNRPEGVPRFNWQQDYFEAFHDPVTGRGRLRRVAQYPSGMMPEAAFHNLVKALNAKCGELHGAPILHSGPGVNGVSGGNLEAAADFCLVGRNSFKTDAFYREYAKSVCGTLDDLVETPSQFLAAGHTDEFFKTVPIPGQRPPCNFAMAIASPRKAFELLEANAKLPAFSRRPEKMEMSGTYKSLCRAFDDMRWLPGSVPGGTPRGGQSLWRVLAPRVARADENILARCVAKMNNGDLKRLVEKHPDLGPLNRQVQERMDAFVKSFKERIKKRYPGCDPPVIEAPQLFWGGGEFETAKSRSIFPNPTNGEAIGAHYLMSDPVNQVFGDEFRRQLKALGVEPTVVNTDFAHRLTGNLHCSTHAVRYCRPRGRVGR